MQRWLVGTGIVVVSAATGLAAIAIINRWSKPTGCVPPATREKCPPNPAAPPAGYKPWAGTVPSDTVGAAQAALKYPIGTWFTGNGYGIMLEWHYHPPCGALKPWGCHKGSTVYRAT